MFFFVFAAFYIVFSKYLIIPIFYTFIYTYLSVMKNINYLCWKAHNCKKAFSILSFLNHKHVDINKVLEISPSQKSDPRD